MTKSDYKKAKRMYAESHNIPMDRVPQLIVEGDVDGTCAIALKGAPENYTGHVLNYDWIER